METGRAQLAGFWKGEIQASPTLALPVQMQFKLDGANWSGSFDSPMQNSYANKFDSVTYAEDGTISAKFELAKIEFVGRIDSAKKSLVGQWKQGTATIPLTLYASENLDKARRPQEPIPPFPYTSEEVSFKNGEIKLSGTLTFGKSEKPSAAVILIQGSGPHDRDETIFMHKPFLLLSDYLTRKGLVVLRYDKRGCAKSTGDYAKASSADFANDVISAIEYLKHRPEVDPKRIGLLGHSEGGVLAPMVAAKSPDVAFIVSMAGSALTGDKILMAQIEAIAKAANLPQDQIDPDLIKARETYDIIKSENDNEKAIAKILERRRQLGFDKSSGNADKDRSEKAAVVADLTKLTGPWYRFFLEYDPSDSWSKVRCPVLAINGENDRQVIASQNLPVISSALSKTGNSRVKTASLPGLNHLFQTSKTGAVGEYAMIEETISPKALELIADWILEQTNSTDPSVSSQK